MVVDIFDPSTREAEAGRFEASLVYTMSSRTASAIYRNRIRQKKGVDTLNVSRVRSHLKNTLCSLTLKLHNSRKQASHFTDAKIGVSEILNTCLGVRQVLLPACVVVLWLKFYGGDSMSLGGHWDPGTYTDQP